MTYKVGDKVLLDSSVNFFLEVEGCKYFIIEKIFPHKQRINKIAYRIVFPTTKKWVIDVSINQLIPYKE